MISPALQPKFGAQWLEFVDVTPDEKKAETDEQLTGYFGKPDRGNPGFHIQMHLEGRLRARDEYSDSFVKRGPVSSHLDEEGHRRYMLVNAEEESDMFCRVRVDKQSSLEVEEAYAKLADDNPPVFVEFEERYVPAPFLTVWGRPILKPDVKTSMEQIVAQHRF